MYRLVIDGYAGFSGNGTALKSERNGHMKSKDTMERSDRRSPYDSYDSERNRNNQKRKPPQAGIGYMILTAVLLLVLFPIGIFFLWSRKIRASAGTKVFIMLITGIIFTGLMILAINYDTGNPRIDEIQKEARGVLEQVDKYTGNCIRKIKDWGTQEYDKAEANFERLYEAADEKIASEALSAYDKVDLNLYAVKVQLPSMLLEKFKELIDYQPPEEEAAVPVKLATPDMGGLTVATVNQATEKEPEEEIALEPVPAPVPTATPKPEPTKAPVVLPEIKDVSLAEVFYTPNGVYYHAKTNCSGMMNAVSHTLKEAMTAGKQHCDSCGVVAFSMMECENYLWVDVKNRAHTTDECAQFAQGAYKILPFDDVYNGSYNYCDECNSTVCYEYMLQNDVRYIKDNEILDEERLSLYEYEKGITVYYGANSRNYHATAECMHMTQDKYIHTLYQALHVDMKQVCELCKPLTEADAIELMRKEQGN